ncbi:hypothetical protein Tsubulata_044784 [Turnera subulata]|uniref:Nudix hydrolase domain-containing protein n=1 Tax=Turnera subulata TaxID=218843 RepID=A0A9Q0G1R7_9ROSI|nr:hypothetical protein Tsubulata_044784 [Turnera subulata]
MATLSSKTFETPQSLSEWLNTRLQPGSLASWGTKPGTKNINNLFLELSQGESTLSDSTPPIRTVHCMVVRILSNATNRVLLESRQDLSNGTSRPRSRPLSEKMRAGESVEEAALRAVKEELGPSWVARVVPGTYKIKEEEREAGSFPGLMSRYVVHTVDARVEGLPEEDFATEEEEYKDVDGGGDGGVKGIVKEAVHVIRHHWTWANSDYVEDA